MVTTGNRLSTNTPYIRDLNAKIRAGEMKVPKFQRPFVWTEDQALALLDSLRRNYPIGSLLLWRTPDRLKTERDLGLFQLPSVDDLSPTEYVLDGQQRVTVLYSVFGAEDADPGFKAAFDLRSQEFVVLSETETAAHQFPLRWLYQTTPLLNFRTRIQDLADASELQTRFDALVNVLTGYQIPVVTLRDLSLEEVGPIFERINSSGTPLSIFDLMVAATWSDGFDLNDKVDEITVALQPKNYGDIRGNTVLKCLAAVQYDSVSRERVIGLRKLSPDPKQINKLVQKTTKAILRAVDQLLTEFRIYSLDFLPYEAHLLILTHVFAKHRTLNANQMKRLRQWFWRTSFSERYRGTNDAFVTKDLSVVEQFVARGVGAVASDFGNPPSGTELRNAVFRKNNSRSRAFTLALAKQHPKNLTNASPIDTADALSVYNKKQFHHIFPEAFLRKLDPKIERSRLLNFAMLSASENNLVSDADPSVYLPKLIADLGNEADAVFASNLIPLPGDYDYANAKLETFIAARLPIFEARLVQLCDGAA
ncbi:MULTISPECIES: DUF262 domain-containing protein [unclassified Microbacterium]|uniref:DUF262 domain-containing protein n=1 Tax=unclassified Microbacterium TaxID=2609290 RepID=UPI001AEEF896|nr:MULTISPECIES: DUF262 domain-containing protein [unclassified Microbacterium]QYM65371.1 DUF262 domain-containing protein [Microbacterium sp. Se5.02b]